MQQMWEPLNQASQGLLGMFVSENQSLSKMLKKLGYSQYTFSVNHIDIFQGLRVRVAHADHCKLSKEQSEVLDALSAGPAAAGTGLREVHPEFLVCAAALQQCD